MARSTFKTVSNIASSSAPTIGRASTSRVTRSQSRDLGNSDHAILGRPKVTRSSRHTSVESAGSAFSKPVRRRKATRAIDIDTDLYMVEEIPEDEQGSPQPSESVMFPPEAIERASSVASSQDNTSGLSIDSIIESLLSLDKCSSKVIEIIPNLLADPNFISAKRMNRLLSHFKFAKEDFGNDLYIDNASILEKLFEKRDPDQHPGRPDAIIYKANIASTLETMLDENCDDAKSTNFLQELDDKFASPFIPASDLKDAKTRKEIFNLGLELRTQLVISMLQERKCRNPDPLIAHIFYQGGGNMSQDDILREGQAKGIAGLGLADTQSYGTAIAARIIKIRRAQPEDAEAYVQELRRKFPWGDFLESLIKWLQRRAKQYEDEIKAKGGAEKIAEALSAVPKPPPASSPPEPSITNTSMAKSAAEKEKRLRAEAENLYRLASNTQSRESRISVAAGPPYPQRTIRKTPPSRATQQETSANDALSAPWSDEVDMEVPSSPLPDLDMHVATCIAASKERQKENRKPTTKRFVDPQDGAKKAAWNEDEDESPVKVPRPSRKRSRREAEEGDGESMFLPRDAQEASSADEGFQEDRRAPNPVRREDKRTRPSPRNQRALYEARLEGGDNPRRRCSPEGVLSEDEGFQDDRCDPKPARRAGNNVPKASKSMKTQPSPRNRARYESPRRRRAGSDGNDNPRRRRSEDDEEFGDENREPVPSQSYSQIHNAALKTLAMNRPRISQSRVLWTEAECDILVELVGQYGNGWSDISKSEDARDFLDEKHRDQGALKDKARNMKVDYLLSRADLPLNFNFVRLGKKEKDKVRKVGLNPNRMEGERIGREAIDADDD